MPNLCFKRPFCPLIGPGWKVLVSEQFSGSYIWIFRGIVNRLTFEVLCSVSIKLVVLILRFIQIRNIFQLAV